jgi:hypothetical protein
MRMQLQENKLNREGSRGFTEERERESSTVLEGYEQGKVLKHIILCFPFTTENTRAHTEARIQNSFTV